MTRALGLLALVIGLVGASSLSILLGSRGVGPITIWTAFAEFDAQDAAHVVIREMRLPRTLLGILVGAALGLSGTLLQGATRNPLADPGIMGINAGAAAFVVTGILLTGTHSMVIHLLLAFAGAVAATFAVYAIASFGREGATPVKLALAGAAISAALYAVTSAAVMLNVDALNELRFWQVGALAGRYGQMLAYVAPVIAVGIVAAVLCGRTLNGLALGDDMATALGQHVARTRFLVFLIVAVMCGAATAACGPIVFVGLVVPHAARAICGTDYRWILAYSLLLGPLLLLAADIAARLVVAPSELQVGVVLGIVGAPLFIALVRFRNLAEI